MLQALFKQKLGRAIQDGTFHGIEDTLTSSVIGLLQYLPDELFWKILRESCGASKETLPEDVGNIMGVHFWERMDAEGTYNSQSVEPDVWIETNLYDVIIEAKRSDSSKDNAQSKYQWFNEIVALENSYGGHLEKGLIFLAIGGNDSLQNQVCPEKDYTIYTASRFDLLGVILKFKETLSGVESSTQYVRLLDDIIQALQYHGVFHTVWLNTLHKEPINFDAERFLNDKWEFDKEDLLSKITQPSVTIQLESLSSLWTIQ